MSAPRREATASPTDESVAYLPITSTKSPNTPYAVCSTPGEIDTVPMVPIKSVCSSSTFDVPPHARQHVGLVQHFRAHA